MRDQALSKQQLRKEQTMREGNVLVAACGVGTGSTALAIVGSLSSIISVLMCAGLEVRCAVLGGEI